VVFAVLAVLPDFFTVNVKVQVPFAFTLTEVAVATHALLGFAFTPTNFTLVELAVVTPILLSTVLAVKVPFLRVGRGVVNASSAE